MKNETEEQKIPERHGGRIDKDNAYLNIAEATLARGTCLRRCFGAVIVKNDEIISTGYTGSPRGCINCCDTGKCFRDELNLPRNTGYDKCRSVHAEMNAIISAPRSAMIGATLYLVGKTKKDGNYVENTEPCQLCRRLIINAGIKTVIARVDGTRYNIFDVEERYVKDDGALFNS